MKERGISVLGSVLFHVVLLILLIKLVPPVRAPLFRLSTEVRIVDPRTIFFPRIVGESEVQTSGSLSPQSTSEVLSVQGSDDLQPVTPVPGVAYLKNLSIGGFVEPTKQSFDLIPTPKSEGGFSLGIDRKKSEYDTWAEQEIREEVDFSKHQVQELSSLPFKRIITDKGREDLSRQIDPDVPHQRGIYDITPWIKRVVDKIRNNWNPPPIDESLALGEVKILLIIGKKGNLITAEIVKSSDFPVFDQTTTAAIRTSAPFPPLPIQFPSERLEAFLVFEFHE
jgi:TonB family protein